VRAIAVASGLLLILGWTGNGQGAEPDLPDRISYQGVLLDDLGAPRTGTVDLSVRIYDHPIGTGAPLYVQHFTGAALTEGVFSIEIGPSGVAADTPEDPLTTSLDEALAGDLAATGPERFLELTVGAEGALSRTQILMVPYALRAGSAASADSAITAITAQNAQNVDGLSAEVITEIWAHTNLDAEGPGNDDPTEGLGDADGDGVANFLDPDNDSDGLTDSQEVSQGSDINLVTPRIFSLIPPDVLANFTNLVEVQGENFEPGVTVVFGSETPTPGALTSTSFEVAVGPQPEGTVAVQVTRLNGEVANASIDFVPLSYSATDHGVKALTSLLSMDVKRGIQAVIGGRNEYGVDVDGNGSIDQVLPFTSHGASPWGNLAVAWDPSGALAGLRCRPVGGAGTDCSVELARDTDADFDLAEETPVVLETITTFARLNAPSLSFDGSGHPVLGYIRRQFDSRATVAHDRDGNGDFTGPNERVVVETFSTTEVLDAELAVDPSDRPAYVFDRSGDGDFDDTVGGNPELSTVASETAMACMGAAFDGGGRLAVVWGNGSNAPQLARDLNADGDFADAGEVMALAATAADACDVAGAPGGGIAAVHNAGALRVLIDFNDDGDFADADEDVELFTQGGSFDNAEIRRRGTPGIPVVATDGKLFVR
jgi:hypothetical protein